MPQLNDKQSRLARSIVKYGSQLETLLVNNYEPIGISEIVPRGKVLMCDDFLTYMNEVGIQVKTVEPIKERVRVSEEEGTYEVLGYKMKVHSSRLIISSNYLAFQPETPEEIRFKILKILAKKIAEKEANVYAKYYENPAKRERIYRSFIEGLSKTNSLDELVNLVAEMEQRF